MSSARFTRQRAEDVGRYQVETRVGGVPQSNYVAIARGKDLVVIRIVGRGNMLNAPALQEFAEQQLTAGFSQFLFDFERCTGLDSTFMGVMVGMGQACESGSALAVPQINSTPADESGDLVPMSPEEALAALAGAGFESKTPAEQKKAAGSGNVSAVNVSKELMKLLSMLGVDNFIKVRGTYDLSKLETTILPEKAMTPVERSTLIYQAHATLVEIDKRNEEQFGDLLRSIEAELGA